MNHIKVLNFIEKNKDLIFPNDRFDDYRLEEMLLSLPDSLESAVFNIPFKDPSTIQFVSVFPGSLGIDRFMMEDIKFGALKFITFGGYGIWWIADIISAKKRCRNYNATKLIQVLNNPSVSASMQQSSQRASNFAAAAKESIPDIIKSVKNAAGSFQNDMDLH